MKNRFLTLALEEVGLAPATEVPDVDIDLLLEEVQADQEEGEAMAAELAAATEGQEGLEALVSSMEAALADPNYSPREYQLQVDHAQTLLARIGCSLGGSLSCESTDGAVASKEAFSDKAKKRGKVVADGVKRVIAWLQEFISTKLAKMRNGLDSLKAKCQKAKAEGKKYESNATAEVEMTVPEGTPAKSANFNGYIADTMAGLEVILAAGKHLDSVADADIGEFLDKTISDVNAKISGLPGKPELQRNGYVAYKKAGQLQEVSSGSSAEELLGANEKVVDETVKLTKEGLATLSSMETKYNGSNKALAANKLSSMFASLAQYSSMLMTCAASAV